MTRKSMFYTSRETNGTYETLTKDYYDKITYDIIEGLQLPPSDVLTQLELWYKWIELGEIHQCTDCGKLAEKMIGSYVPMCGKEPQRFVCHQCWMNYGDD